MAVGSHISCRPSSRLSAGKLRPFGTTANVPAWSSRSTEALLVIGLLVAVAASLSGLTHGTVLSTSVLAVATGAGLALAGVVEIEPDEPGLLELIELALILTLFADGLIVERELLRLHWGPPRARSWWRCR